MKRLAKITIIPALMICIAGLSLGSGSSGFTHGIIIPVDGENYYFAGPADGPNGESDIPGHYWVMLGEKELAGKHFNTGPSGAANWWSSDVGDGELLYNVDAIIDTWSEIKAIYYISKGFIHYHELVRVSDGALHPSKVVWLKHEGQTNFTLDGGPHPELSHEVNLGLDLDFIPNALDPYAPEEVAMEQPTIGLLSTGVLTANGWYEEEEIYYLLLGVEEGVTQRGRNDLYLIGDDRAYQANVAEFIPGEAGYTPHWNVNKVHTAPGVTLADILASPYASTHYPEALFDDVADILAAEAAGLVTIEVPGVVVLCPIIPEEAAEAPGNTELSEVFPPFPSTF